MNLSFENRAALVTGAGSGIGLATAKAFAESGAAAVLADWNEKLVRAATDELVAQGHKALAVVCDVSDDAQVEAMVKKTVAISEKWMQRSTTQAFKTSSLRLPIRPGKIMTE